MVVIIQLLTNRFDRNTYCTVSGGNFVQSLSFLKSKSVQSYSATYDLIGLLTPKIFQFII